ncbi:xanthine dehydrogenase accessory protein XdhC [Loktanella sp. SALINAS62]|uniref:xanthine dehydrogenase accessory protein XdhC n=1 Tax=Loktanella sp. SALINAS62 TaxID=2706124 RepID=UPI001B8B9E4F|nr:xanthine dehydrogenase accessory protein XdhC [Loktanella sp. SALINAS62]MBS1301231.1 xanthine dehydrogenase accessory protein XdhC [Loktanella sp. SALINAS62]
MTGIRITVARTAGSVPREAGTAMWVGPDRTHGTIGGGALEWDAIAQARRMLADGATQARQVIPLGPALGQCCGGSVTLEFVAADMPDRPQGPPLWIYGAGHVGRALVDVIAPLPDWSITWVDDAADRFPTAIPDGVTPLVAADMTQGARHAPDDAEHLILTYSHRIDLDLCHAILSRPFSGAGLIGSATKWARFQSRLRVLGHTPAQIARIACPIGDPALGKHPQAIAISVAGAMIRRTAARQERHA